MSSVRLVTPSGLFITDVPVVDGHAPPNCVVWGTRLYVRRDDGDYQEALGRGEQAVALTFNLPTRRGNEDGF